MSINNSDRTELNQTNSNLPKDSTLPAGRLRQIREELNLNQSEFGESIGLTQAGVSKFEMGLIPLRKLILLAIEHAHGIRGEWLIYGEEPKYLSRNTLNKSDVEMLEISAKLNSADRDVLEGIGNFGCKA